MGPEPAGWHISTLHTVFSASWGMHVSDTQECSETHLYGKEINLVALPPGSSRQGAAHVHIFFVIYLDVEGCLAADVVACWQVNHRHGSQNSPPLWEVKESLFPLHCNKIEFCCWHWGTLSLDFSVCTPEEYGWISPLCSMSREGCEVSVGLRFWVWPAFPHQLAIFCHSS